MTITAEQMRAARALVHMEQAELANISDVSVGTIRRLEGLSGPVNAQDTTLSRLTDALERAGAEFTDATHTHGPGVRLRTAPADPFRNLAEQIAAAQPGDDLTAIIEQARKLLA